MALKRSRIAITTDMGFFGEEKFPAEVIADMTEAGEVLISIERRASWADGDVSATAYLTPTDAAVLGFQLIEASRAAVPPPPGDPS